MIKVKVMGASRSAVPSHSLGRRRRHECHSSNWSAISSGSGASKSSAILTASLSDPISRWSALRDLRDSNPELFAVIRTRLVELCGDPGGRQRRRAFRLTDGRTARLATYYDTVARRELALVWLVEEVRGGEPGTLKVVALEPAD